MPRRLRENDQEETDPKEIPTPQNEAGKTSDVAVLDGNNNNNNKNNPLLKIWCIQRVLLFVRQNGIVYFPASFSTATQQTDVFQPIPRLFQLKNVTSSWNETAEFYIYRIPSDVVASFCDYLLDFVRKHSKSEQHATVARDALLWMSMFIKDAESVKECCECIFWAIDDNLEANRRIFGTEQVRDAFVMISEFSTCDEASNEWCYAVRRWCSAIWWLTLDNEFNQRVFGTTEILNCFVSLSKEVVSPSSAIYSWCVSLRNIIKLKENQQLFATVELRDSMILLAKIITGRDDSRCWLKMLSFFTDDESNKKLFFGGALQAEKERIKKIYEDLDFGDDEEEEEED